MLAVLEHSAHQASEAGEIVPGQGLLVLVDEVADAVERIEDEMRVHLGA